MDNRVHQIAALANAAAYDTTAVRQAQHLSGHLRHASLRDQFVRLLISTYDEAAAYTSTPHVLDLGAGEGAATIPLLELGARVTAVDISKSQSEALREKCQHYTNRVEITCAEVFDALNAFQQAGRKFDAVVAISFLHHVPDYLALIRKAIRLLEDHGQFFSFQDPLRYDSVSRPARGFSLLAFFSWRIFQGDVIGGIQRRIRRQRGVYLDDCPLDHAEYHVVRKGVDQEAICHVLEERGFAVELVRYFSTITPAWQRLGVSLGVKSHFAVRASK